MASNSELSILNKDLFSYWKLDGNAQDSVGHYDGIETNITYQNGKKGQAAYFNGIGSNKINCGNLPLSNLKKLTISAWVKPDDAIISQYMEIASMWPSGNQTISLTFYGSRYLVGFIGDGLGGFAYYFYDFTSYNGDWAHCAFVYDGAQALSINRLKAYYNGVEIPSLGTVGGTLPEIPSSLGPANGDFNIGYLDGTNYIPTGKIDEVGVWFRALEPKEISLLYNNGNAITYPFRNYITPRRILQFGSTNLQEGIVSYHKLDGNSKDSITNNYGTDLLMSYVPGKIGQSANFNGAGYIDDIGTTSTYSFMQNTGIFTISFWLKLNDYTFNPQYFMGSSPTTVQKGFYIGMGASGNFEFTVLNGNSNEFIYIISSLSLDDNEWHMYTLTADGNNCYLYKDAVLHNTVSKTATLTTGDSFAANCFGRIQNYGLSYLRGQLDEVGFWNKNFTQGDILNLYNNSKAFQYPFTRVLSNENFDLSKGLLSYWKFDGDSVDSIGGNNGSEFNISYVPGKLNQAASFDGLTSLFDTNTSFNYTGGSVSLWVKPSGSTSGDQRIVAGGQSSPTYLTYAQSINQLTFYYQDSISQKSLIGQIYDNVWSHIVFTWNSTKICLYINNKLVASDNAGSMDSYLTVNLYLGARQIGLSAFGGLIDETGMWNRSLNKNEISKLYSVGIGSQYPFNNKIITSEIDYYSEAFAIYSVRKISPNYFGPCLRVRRSNDNAEMDINFLDDKNLDTSTLLNFVGSNHGLITIWYDQKDNKNNLFQENNSLQPYIVINGDLVVKNNRPSSYAESGQFLHLNNNVSMGTEYTFLGVVEWPQYGKEWLGASYGNTYGIYNQDTVTTYHNSSSGISASYFIYDYVNIQINQRNILQIHRDNTNSTLNVEGASFSTTIQGGNNIEFNFYSLHSEVGGNYSYGYIQETILFKNNKQNQSSQFYQDINSYYS